MDQTASLGGSDEGIDLVYDAFITYSRKDSAFAGWLEKKLERYRAPGDLSAGRSRLNVFRDVQDLVGNELTDAIEDAIRQSRKLIVVCSPWARDSKWVAKEINSFATHHGTSGIIPILVDGRPNNEVTPDDARQDKAFPDALLAYLAEPLAADFRKHRGEGRMARSERRHEAVFQVLALLFGTDKDALLRRHLRRRRRLQIFALTASLALTVIFGWLAYSAYRSDKEAREMATVSRSRELAAIAREQLSFNPEVSVLIAREAARVRATPQAVDILRRSLGQHWLRKVLETGSGEVTSVAFSPNDSLIAVAKSDGSISLWSLTERKQVAEVAGGQERIFHLEFDSVGRRLLATSLGVGCLWDVAERRLVREFPAGEGYARFLDDDQSVIAPYDGARIWDVESGRLLLRLPAHGEEGTMVAASSRDGKLVATGDSDGVVRVWNAVTRKLRRSLPAGKASRWFQDAEFSPDGNRILVLNSKGGAQVWDLRDGSDTTAAYELVHGGEVSHATFSPDGRYIATASSIQTQHEKTVRVWESLWGKLVREYRGHTAWVEDLAFSHDGRYLASANTDGTVLVWETPCGLRLQSMELSGSGRAIYAVGIDGQVLTVSERGHNEARLVQISDSATAVSLKPTVGAFFGGAFSDDGKLLASLHSDGSVRLWSTATGGLLHEWKAHKYFVLRAQFSRDGAQLVTVGEDEGWTGSKRVSSGAAARVWRVSDGSLVGELVGHKGRIAAAAFDQDSRQIVTAGWDGRALLWDWPAGTLRATLEGHDENLTSVAFSPDGALIATGSKDETARIWDVATGRLLRVLRGHRDEVTEVAFSSDGRWLLTAGNGRDKAPRIWEVATGNLVLEFEGQGSRIVGAVFGTGGQKVVNILIATSKSVHRYRCETCASLEELLALSAQRETRALFPEERRLYLNE